MKKILPEIITALLCICLLNACKKGFNDQQSVFPNPQQPDLTTQASFTVTGFVTDENGDAALNAIVTAGNKSATTDAFGYFKIAGAMLSKTAPFITINKQGYFDTYRTFTAKENTTIFTRVKLVPQTIAGTINAAAGGTVTMENGSAVTLPPSAVVNATTNALYTGAVHVAAHLFKQDDTNEWAATIPGDNRGIDTEGQLKVLRHYGMLAVELRGDAGELLQVAPGKEATITTPIPAALIAGAPSNIPLAYFDVTKGLWKQEGNAVKNGNRYIGRAAHFTFWDFAGWGSGVKFTAQIVNTSLQPLPFVFATIRSTGQSYNNFGYGYPYTNSDGTFTAFVPANESFTLDVLTPCNTVAYTHPFTTTDSDIDLGTIMNGSDENMVTISGTAVDCTQSPLTDGTLILYSGTYQWQVPIINGNFNSSFLACSNMPASYVAINNATQQQGSVSQSTLLVETTNNLGQLQACGTNAETYFNMTVDGVDTSFIESPSTIEFQYSPINNFFPTTAISVYSYRENTGYVGFNFDGGTGTGSNHWLSNGQEGHEHAYLNAWYGYITGRTSMTALAPVQVTITEWGSQGEFIAGSFTGVFQADDLLQHNISCSFRVRIPL